MKVGNFNSQYGSVSQYASPCKILRQSVAPLRRYGHFSNFQDGGRQRTLRTLWSPDDANAHGDNNNDRYYDALSPHHVATRGRAAAETLFKLVTLIEDNHTGLSWSSFWGSDMGHAQRKWH